MEFSRTKSQESDTDTETPLLQTHLSRALSLTNGSLLHGSPPPPRPPPQVTVVSYKECLKNHAASLGGLALDGCGEFLPITPSSSSSSSELPDPTSLKCAACGCHRNFHRRETYGLPAAAAASVVQLTSRSTSPSSTSPPPRPRPASPIPQQSVYPSAPHMLLALSTGRHCGPRNLTQQEYQERGPQPPNNKRARTKFTEEQKEKMYVFAERLGWRMIRANEDDDKRVDDFCSQIGVKRNVFKVWMHNNKQRTKDIIKPVHHGNGNGVLNS